MNIDDMYKTLGISKHASLEDIKKTYRKKAQEMHPDKRVKGDQLAENEFKSLNNAYHSILEDKKNNPIIEKNKKKASNINDSMNTSYSSDLFNILFNQNFRNNSSIFDREDNYTIGRRTNQNSIKTYNRCNGIHDRYTICLKCK
jgi:DnaJ-class molecular chaperone